ncbi:MAG: DNA polymerase IV [Blautia sp.]|nr:DNA polymerase IV [Blautia sp.]
MADVRKIIFHVDVNSAFLSWSAVKRLKEDPGAVDLRTIPSAVGGDVETRHGVITAKSIPAKAFGVKTGEPVVKALRKCPSLVLVRSDFETYREYSRAFIRILKEYSPLVQQVSIDEAYMDMTESLDSFTGLLADLLVRTDDLDTSLRGLSDPSLSLSDPYAALAILAAGRIREQVRSELGFTVNVGISTNKLLAKTASDFGKPDKTHTLFPEEIPEKFWPLPIQELHGCGSSTARRLQDLGIHTIGDAANADISMLRLHLGEKGGMYIHNSTNGLGSSTVHSEHEEAKSYSNELTTALDINASNFEKEALPLLAHLADKVSSRLKRDGFYASTLGIMVKTDRFLRHSRQVTLRQSTNSRDQIYERAEELLRQLLYARNGLFEKGEAIRLIGISAANLDRGEFRQLNLLEYAESLPSPVSKKETPPDPEKARRLERMMEQIRTQYGKEAIHKGSAGS